MSKNYYIGIDGGGSKTQLRMFDANGNILAETIAGPANIYISTTISYNSILEAFKLAIEQVKMTNKELKSAKFHAGIGVAGFEVKKAREEFLKKKFPFDFVNIQSDVTIACLGAHGGKDGAVVIAGTGVVGLKIYKGHKRIIGGWGFPHGDEGGGAWLGLEAVRKVFHMLDNQEQASPFLNKIKNQIGPCRQEVTQWVCSASATQYASLVPIIVKFAQKKDKIALSLVKEAAKKVEKMLACFLENSVNKKQQLPCCLLGGLSPILLKYVKKEFRDSLISPQKDPCAGAILLTKKIF